MRSLQEFTNTTTAKIRYQVPPVFGTWYQKWHKKTILHFKHSHARMKNGLIFFVLLLKL